MEVLKHHRSVRKYAQKEISTEFLNGLLETAARTQTMGNLQLYSVVVTRSEKIKEQLAPAHFNQPCVKGAPVILTICADFRRTTTWANCREANPGYDNVLSFANAATDALLYTQSFCHIAEEQGLGYCFLGTTIYMPSMIIDVLKLPKLVMPVATITLGWPDESPKLSDRLPLCGFIHNETYNDYTPEAIDEIYRHRESLEENINFCHINNKKTLAQVFTDIRYTRKDNEALSTTFIEALKHQGFIK